MNEEKLKLKKSFMLFARFEFKLNQTLVSTQHLHTHVCVMLTLFTQQRFMLLQVQETFPEMLD